jgi:nitrogen fixation protein NifB
MRHCHQCRADAVGLLGEDRGQEFTQEKLADAQELDYPQALSRRVVVQAALRRRVMHHREPTAVIPLFTASGQGRLRSVVMAIATTGDGLVNQAFHATQELLLYEVSAAGMRLLKRHTLEPNVASGGLQEEPPLLQILDVLQGCEVLLSGRIGMAAWQALEAAGIHPNVEHGLEPIEAAARQVYREVVAAGPLSPVPFQQISTSA